MWNRSSSTQRIARIATGSVIAAGVVVVPFTLDGPGNPVVMAGHVSDIAIGLLDDSRRIIPIDFGGMDPASLRTDGETSLAGTVVYAEEPDGTGIIVGSIVERDGGYAVALRPDQAEHYRGNSHLLYARPVYDVREAIGLICAPGGAEAELEHAKRVLLPVVQRELLTPLEKRFREEIEIMLRELPDQHSDDIDALVEDLRTELKPEIDQLTELLAGAAWDEIGVWGVAEGAGRKTLNAGEAALDWTRETVGSLFGADKKKGEPERRPRDFLSDDRKQKISNAVMAEGKKFWKDNKDTILVKAERSLGRHQSGFMKRVEEEWLPKLYDRVVKTTWNEKGSIIEDALSAFARDFAQRRLTTKGGAPTLALAYSVRSATLITERPLFVIQRDAKVVTESNGADTSDPGEVADAEASEQPKQVPATLKLFPYSTHRRAGSD
jgi:hypothetical protein